MVPRALLPSKPSHTATRAEAAAGGGPILLLPSWPPWLAKPSLAAQWPPPRPPGKPASQLLGGGPQVSLSELGGAAPSPECSPDVTRQSSGLSPCPRPASLPRPPYAVLPSPPPGGFAGVGSEGACRGPTSPGAVAVPASPPLRGPGAVCSPRPLLGQVSWLVPCWSVGPGLRRLVPSAAPMPSRLRAQSRASVQTWPLGPPFALIPRSPRSF